MQEPLRERRMPIGIGQSLFIEMQEAGFNTIDEYVLYLKGQIKKLQTANKKIQEELLTKVD